MIVFGKPQSTFISNFIVTIYLPRLKKSFWELRSSLAF